MKTEVVVIGSGPGGYAAAFRAADLGKKVTIIERGTFGGVCLNVGCIPSKALLHAAKVIDEAKHVAEYGITFGNPKIDTKKLVEKKNKIINGSVAGLTALAKQRKVEIINGAAKFIGPHSLQVGKDTIEFEQCIIAVGSEPVKLPFIPEDPRIIDSTGALELKNITGDMLIIGGGIIGMEMANVYSTLGAKVSVVELMDQLIPGADADLVKIFHKSMEPRLNSVMLKTKVTKVEAKKDGIWVTFEGEQAPAKAQRYDLVLVAVGRKPNGATIDAEKAGVKVDERGFISVDTQLRTNVPHIFAIGDVNGNPMLAHKATHEGHVAAEVAAGKKHFFDPRCIPSVAYTDPEIAWVGLTENEANAKGINYEKAVFPWPASGRAHSIGRSDGSTKLLFDKNTNRILGAGIVGPNAGDLISEVALAIEMGCDAEDIALTIHPHPTLSETIMMSAEIFEGTITDLYKPKKKD